MNLPIFKLPLEYIKDLFLTYPELTYMNHIKFGYNSKNFAFRKNASDRWFAKYGRCKRKPHNFHDECLETARLIAAQTNEPIFVLFSGGVDSEVTLRSFHEAQIQVTAAILRFKHDLNIHDISWAIIICEQLNIPYKIFDLDILDFWREKADQYANATYCVSPQLLSTMWLIDQIPGYPVMGSAECLLVKNNCEISDLKNESNSKTQWKLLEKEKIAAWYRHFIVRKKNGCPGFFQYTPEIMLSYLKDPFVQKLINNQIQGETSTETSKLKIYQQHFPLINRPKYTGFEKLKNQDFEYRKRLLERFPGANEVQETHIDELINQLSPNL